ncbi:hypothetical protein CCMA1212_003478 [Trichoderma ghanense]|uniref:Uncharacterized protein n=1 Tax=Trichoderma ghanense TaxID=65468 RepID=A0ABY2H8I6_9HYPO
MKCSCACAPLVGVSAIGAIGSVGLGGLRGRLGRGHLGLVGLGHGGVNGRTVGLGGFRSDRRVDGSRSRHLGGGGLDLGHLGRGLFNFGHLGGLGRLDGGDVLGELLDGNLGLGDLDVADLGHRAIDCLDIGNGGRGDRHLRNRLGLLDGLGLFGLGLFGLGLFGLGLFGLGLVDRRDGLDLLQQFSLDLLLLLDGDSLLLDLGLVRDFFGDSRGLGLGVGLFLALLDDFGNLGGIGNLGLERDLGGEAEGCGAGADSVDVDVPGGSDGKAGFGNQVAGDGGQAGDVNAGKGVALLVRLLVQLDVLVGALDADVGDLLARLELDGVDGTGSSGQRIDADGLVQLGAGGDGEAAGNVRRGGGALGLVNGLFRGHCGGGGLRSNGVDQGSCGVGLKDVLGRDEVVDVALVVGLLGGGFVYRPVSVDDVLNAAKQRRTKVSKTVLVR